MNGRGWLLVFGLASSLLGTGACAGGAAKTWTTTPNSDGPTVDDQVCAGYQRRVDEALARSGPEQAEVEASYGRKSGCSIESPRAPAANATNRTANGGAPQSVEDQVAAGREANRTRDAARHETERKQLCEQMTGLVDQKLRAGDRRGAGTVAEGMNECGNEVQRKLAKYDAEQVVVREQQRVAARTRAPDDRDVRRISDFLPACRSVLGVDSSKRDPAQDGTCGPALHAQCAASAGQPNSEGVLERLAWSFTNEATTDQSFPKTWVAAQDCVAQLISQDHGDTRALDKVKALVERASYQLAADCLDGCILSSSARSKVDASEAGLGYAQRYEAAAAGSEQVLANAKVVGEAREASKLAQATSAEAAAHKDRLKEKYDGVHARVEKVVADAAVALPVLARREIDAALTAAAIPLRTLADAAASKKPIAQEVVDKAADDARTQINTAGALLADYTNIPGLDAERYAKEIAAARKELTDKATAIVKRLDHQDAVARVRGDLCNIENTLTQLHERERNDKRVDERSGTVNLAERRRTATALIFLEDKRTDALRQLSSLGADFSLKRDCQSKP